MSSFTTLINFNGTDGATPYAGLIADHAGNLYGTTSGGGANSDGTVFEVTTTSPGYSSTPTTLVNFNGTNGATPFAALLADSNGNLYGSTTSGGTSNAGTLYELAITTTGYAAAPTTLTSFNGGNGASPAGTLIAVSGALVGTTGSGGATDLGFGTVFDGAEVSFNNTDGANPFAGLIADAAGNLFGTTVNGGANGDGVVFEIPLTAGVYATTPTVLVNFNGANGANSYSTLTADTAGDLFGTTQQGGANGDGTVFEIVKTAAGYTLTTLVSFAGANGSNPTAGLIMDAAGNLFGTTVNGGTNSEGTVFEIARTADGYASTPITLFNFNSTNGANPIAGVIADSAGDLFGTTAEGGANAKGTVFELSGAGFEIAGPIVSNTTGSQQTLVAPIANSTIQGDGYDILNLSQNPIASAFSAYALTANGDGTLELTTTGSADHVAGVMQVTFADQTQTIAANGSESEYIALLYQGALGRTPDAPGLAGWEQIAAALPAATQALGVYGLSDAAGGYNAGLSIAAGFTNSPEFIAKYGSLTNAQFVTNLYANVLDRAPDPTGFAGWMSQLTAGTTREHVLVGFADSQEAISNATVGFTGQSGAHAAWLFLV